MHIPTNFVVYTAFIILSDQYYKMSTMCGNRSVGQIKAGSFLWMDAWDRAVAPKTACALAQPSTSCQAVLRQPITSSLR